MAFTSIRIDKAALNAAVFESPGMPKFWASRARIAAEGEFEDRRNNMLNEAENNPVSRDIESGNTGEGGILGYGNLFSYIGFKKDSNPVQTLISLLSEIRMDPIPTRNSRLGRFYFKVNLPTRKEIGSETSKDLGTIGVDSWPHALEEGLTNLSQYLYDAEGLSRSTSGTGLQVRGIVKEREFPDLSGQYITKILDKMILGRATKGEA